MSLAEHSAGVVAEHRQRSWIGEEALTRLVDRDTRGQVAEQELRFAAVAGRELVSDGASVACYQQAPFSLLRCDSASFAQLGPVS
ncbi:MAG: hypothetical protein CSA65_02230 [Proteobacteria bacterium]|nr:MAG: hypothetical protein CSA65_02230 [Pseudomonadota bacterium]